jgi:hypothetical protein
MEFGAVPEDAARAALDRAVALLPGDPEPDSS